MAKLTSAQLKVVAKKVLEGIKDTHNANNEALLAKNKATHRLRYFCRHDPAIYSPPARRLRLRGKTR